MSEIIVAKFGGSSLADCNQFKKVKEIVDSNKARKFIIPSAPGKRSDEDHKITDLLYMTHQLASHELNFDEVYSLIETRYIDICKGLKLDFNIKDILDEVRAKIENGGSKDYSASRGEYLNGLILSQYLGFEFVDPAELIVFDNKGAFDELATENKARKRLEKVEKAVIPGFYGANEKGEIVNFTRGGSDITGAIIANAVRADLYENWTDVSGLLMADPRIVKSPKTIENITYKELRELSYMGASVFHGEAVFPVQKSAIPINIKNTNLPDDKGTMIVDDKSPIVSSGITGVSGKKDFTVISIEKNLMNVEKGFLRKVLSVFETNHISIEHVPTGIDSISVVVSSSQLNGKLDRIIEELKIYCNPDSISCHPNMAILAVVGRGMIRTKGISSRVFTALGRSGVNVRMITQGSSELNIIIGIENEDFELGLQAIYKEFQA